MAKRNIRLLAWNVNGIRAVAKKGFPEFLEAEKPDILCVQETKFSNPESGRDRLDFDGYAGFWNGAKRPGYSGTAVFIRNDGPCSDARLVRAHGFGESRFDDEGRIQVLDVGGFYLVNAYFPNAAEGLTRLGYKLEFNDYLLSNLKKLEKQQPVVVCGDFNVAHREIDLARPKDNVGNAGFTPEERAWMDKFLASGFKDTFRSLHGDLVQYTWWSYRFNARAKNIGWRIDYFCVSESFLPQVKRSFVLDRVQGSDHCPVGLEVVMP